MPEYAAQASFNAGEWAPALNARVDLQKYRSGAALLSNWFVDYRGGASTRPGSKYVIRCLNSALPVRLIPFQASFNVGYALEFGDHYIRFIFQGAAVLESTFAISGATRANPCVITVAGNNYAVGDWIFISSVGGMTQLNGRYFIVSAVAGSSVTLSDLNNVGIDSTGYNAYTSGGTTGRVYTISSPYAAADLQLLKFATLVDQMIITHPNYPTQVLTIITATNWTIAPIVIGSTVTPPTGVTVTTTLAAGSASYSYVVTAVDQTGQESQPSAPASLLNKQDIRNVPGSNQISWTPVDGAQQYNIYRAELSYFGVLPAGVQYGFIGISTQPNFIDSNIGPDFTETPPVATNPFSGSSISSSVVVTVRGSYTTFPIVTFSGSATVPAAGKATMFVVGATIASGGTGYSNSETVYFPNGVIGIINGVGGGGTVTSINFYNKGAATTPPLPTNPVHTIGQSGAGSGLTVNFTWGVYSITVTAVGAGYLSAPTVVFSPASAAATATLQAPTTINPSVVAFFGQRLIFAATATMPQTFWGSKPGQYFNFDVSEISQADDSITATLVSNTLNTIKSIVSSTAGMLLLTDKGPWVVNGGSPGSAIAPSALVANAQSFVGANDVPPIVANYSVLYVQSKGSAVRDLAFNVYFQLFTGTDVSVIASHLFYGHQILQWAWAEQPFYLVWAVRDDGVMLTLTFLKEQDFVGWTHHSTVGGLYKSVCVVTENTASAGNVDAVYTVVQRTVQGNTVQYIERLAERIFPNGAVDAWCVDAALQYVGAPRSTFGGAEHLAGLTCTGLADGVVIPPFTMPASGVFTLSTPASKVTVGLGYNCDLQTLALDVSDDHIQGRVKRINSVVVRVNQTLNLNIGADFDHLLPVKDLFLGSVSSGLTGQESQVVNDLTTSDAIVYIPSTRTVPGQYCLRQSDPYPASVLGVFPSFSIGDRP
jgi:hypothetical protein